MKSFPLNGKPLATHFRDFSGGVVRVRHGRVEIFADDKKDTAESVKKAGGGVVPRKTPLPVVTTSTQPAKSGDVALTGPDGRAVTNLLAHAEKEGADFFAAMAQAAIKRLLREPQKALGAVELFTPEEQVEIADKIAATNATANLLGRSRVRLRQQRAEAMLDQFDETEPTRFSEAFGPTKFASGPSTPPPIKPLAPTAAIAWFKRKVPTVRVNVHQFTQEQRDKAFWLARQTDARVLSKIKQIIYKVLATGQGAGEAPHLIQTVLDKTGLAPENPSYAATVFRTNLMEAYRAGEQEERNKPEVQEVFPVWKYLGIDDGREGDDHRPHFDQYYPSGVPFEKIRNMYVVRGGRVVVDPTGKGRPFNCRCVAQEISKYRWGKLKQAGAAIAAGFTDPTETQATTFAESPEVFDDLVACGVSPALARELDIPADGEVSRSAFNYDESRGEAIRCQHCKHFQPEQVERLGTCGLFECLRVRDDRRYNLLPDVGAHMWCRAFEQKRETPEARSADEADYLRDQARQFWEHRARERANKFAEQNMAESLAPAMHKLADVIERHHQPQPAPVVNVAAPIINVPQPIVNVAAPEVKVAAPDVHVASPVVNVQPAKVQVKVEAAKAPDVRVTVPPIKVPAPKVTVRPNIEVNPKVEIPPRKTTKEVQYDSDGNVKRVTETEQDA